MSTIDRGAQLLSEMDDALHSITAFQEKRSSLLSSLASSYESRAGRGRGSEGNGNDNEDNNELSTEELEAEESALQEKLALLRSGLVSGGGEREEREEREVMAARSQINHFDVNEVIIRDGIKSARGPPVTLESLQQDLASLRMHEWEESIHEKAFLSETLTGPNPSLDEDMLESMHEVKDLEMKLKSFSADLDRILQRLDDNKVDEMASVKTQLPSLHLHLDESLSDLDLSDPEEGEGEREGELCLEEQGN